MEWDVRRIQGSNVDLVEKLLWESQSDRIALCSPMRYLPRGSDPEHAADET